MSIGTPLTTEFVREYCESNGFILHGGFIKSTIKIDVECKKCGLRRGVKFGDFQRKASCPVCSGTARKSISEIEAILSTRGYTLVEYGGNTKKLLVKCSNINHQPYWTTLPRFQNNHGCPECYGNTKYTTEQVRNHLLSEGYTLLSPEYHNNKEPLLMRCPNGHEVSIRYDVFIQYHRCGQCIASGPELDIQKHISTIYNGVFTFKEKGVISSSLTGHCLELDFWFPDLHKAIEYNGSYWHSSEVQMQRDKIKLEQCALKGINILVITEDKWSKHRTKHLQSIKEFLA